MKLPFLTQYDPPGSSEGSLDPLSLYPIADQMALRLVPGVRERMQRIRFLTPMAVGAVVTEGMEPNPRHPGTPPFLVWEWIVVQAIIASGNQDDGLWGVPGSSVVKSALGRLGYVDDRSYLKTPRVFGFHGVYKRLAVHLGIVDTHLKLRAPYGDGLVRAWARDCDLGDFDPSHTLCRKLRDAVYRSLQLAPPRTATGWRRDDWQELAEFFFPHRTARREKKTIEHSLQEPEARNSGAFNVLWSLMGDIDVDTTTEREVHERVLETAPGLSTLIEAIFAYESFSRNITDAFTILRAEASKSDLNGFSVTALGQDTEFRDLAAQTASLYNSALVTLSEADQKWVSLFEPRFSRFAEVDTAEQLALSLLEHHEAVQRAKSYEGKRTWFDCLSTERIYMRMGYRVPRPEIGALDYVHDYRLRPLKRFHSDLH